MAPNIVDTDTWQRAEILMQPIFIRLIDHFRKVLEDSPWKGDYQQREIWPDSIPESVKQHRQDLITQLATASNQEDVALLEIELETLPTPYPGYELHLYLANENPERSPHTDPIAIFDLWQICYHICFTNYPLDAQDCPVAIVDTHLLDEDGDVDWQQVDQKTGRVVQHLFNTLSLRVENETR
ncbi:MAG: hypothetical protein ACOYME_08655 [Prochlorotrichaceae cyanobacterium]|jgi:hypothetical protein